ncbi:MAG: YebC/PmpR family DNA-binding transcriptional regulator [Patescibacteria group bacterium]
MSGHSRWSQIKRQKGAQDVKRGTLFTKLGRAITVAVRQGGPDPATNDRLRMAIEQAKTANMPNANIERVLKKGTGELADGEIIEEIIYEGFGRGGVAVMVQVLTNNRNRTTTELRNLFTKYGGNLGTQNSVSWMFTSRGVITINAKGNDIEKVTMDIIDAGADDLEETDNEVVAYTKADKWQAVKNKIKEAGYNITESNIEPVANDQITIDEKAEESLAKFFTELQSLDDVINFFTNAQTKK